jgi:alpha-glucosidase (family GH31 glycosyl hydrolase)
MPYIYAQAKLSSERGYPMLRALFFEYPEDPVCWMIEDQYMFGEDMLVAPLMEEAPSRTVYLPPGRWVDYQNTATYEGARWHRIEAGEVPAVVLVRHGGGSPASSWRRARARWTDPDWNWRSSARTSPPRNARFAYRPTTGCTPYVWKTTERN